MAELQINHRIVAPTTETDAERAWRYGLERTNLRDQFYGYVTFQDDSMMTKVGSLLETSRRLSPRRRATQKKTRERNRGLMRHEN